MSKMSVDRADISARLSQFFFYLSNTVCFDVTRKFMRTSLLTSKMRIVMHGVFVCVCARAHTVVLVH